MALSMCRPRSLEIGQKDTSGGIWGMAYIREKFMETEDIA